MLSLKRWLLLNWLEVWSSYICLHSCSFYLLCLELITLPLSADTSSLYFAYDRKILGLYLAASASKSSPFYVCASKWDEKLLSLLSSAWSFGDVALWALIWFRSVRLNRDLLLLENFFCFLTFSSLSAIVFTRTILFPCLLAFISLTLLIHTKSE